MSYRYTPQDLKTLQARGPVKNKFGNKKVVVDNIGFDSKREAARYNELKLMRNAELISSIDVHPVYPIYIKDMKVCDVVLDFAYTIFKDSVPVHEDVKSPGTNTALSKLKRKMVEAYYGFKVTLVF
jgi:hypothetical protein